MHHTRCRLIHAVALASSAVFASASLAQWSNDAAANLLIAGGAGDQVLPKIMHAPGGGVWISWFNNASGNYNVYAQYLNADGVPQLPAGGVLVSNHPSLSSLVDYDLNVDSSGNALIIFTDARAGTDRDIYAYRVSQSGSMLWGADGVTLSANDSFEADPRITQTSDGQFVAIWPRSAPGQAMMMQRLDADGNKLFGTDGIVAAGNGSENPAFCEMIPGEDGSVIVIYIRDTATFSSPRHVHAQKYSSTGQPLWGGKGGTPIILSSAVVPIAHRPRILSDGQGGAIFAWHNTQTGAFNVWVQRVTSNGTVLFPDGGAQAANFPARLHLDPALAFLPETNETLVVWNERNTAQSQWGIYAQRLSPTGARILGDEGVVLLPVNTVNKLSPRATNVAGGALVFLLEQVNPPSQHHRALAMRIDANANLVWGALPLVASSAPSGKARLPVTASPDGVAKLIWEDDRNGQAYDIYAQNVRPDGTLGNPTVNPADLNGDGSVGPADLGILLGSWGNPGCGGALPCAADLNGDGNVGAADLGILLGSWGE